MQASGYLIFNYSIPLSLEALSINMLEMSTFQVTTTMQSVAHCFGVVYWCWLHVFADFLNFKQFLNIYSITLSMPLQRIKGDRQRPVVCLRDCNYLIKVGRLWLEGLRCFRASHARTSGSCVVTFENSSEINITFVCVCLLTRLHTQVLMFNVLFGVVRSVEADWDEPWLHIALP